MELFRLLGGGVPGDLTGLPKSQLAILPGTTHVSMVVERTQLWLPMIRRSLMRLCQKPPNRRWRGTSAEVGA